MKLGTVHGFILGPIVFLLSVDFYYSLIASTPRWTALPQWWIERVARRGTPSSQRMFILHFVWRITPMFWERMLAILAGWAVIPALAWALVNEVLRSIR